MHIRIKPYEAVDAGEFIEKETGEVIKWGAGFLCWAFMPDTEPLDLHPVSSSVASAVD